MLIYFRYGHYYWPGSEIEIVAALFILTQHWHVIRVILPFENILLAVSVLLFELLIIEALVLTNLSRAVSSRVSCTHSPGATPAIEPQLNGQLFNIFNIKYMEIYPDGDGHNHYFAISQCRCRTRYRNSIHHQIRIMDIDNSSPLGCNFCNLSDLQIVMQHVMGVCQRQGTLSYQYQLHQLPH
jgi:hypothetical protein